MTQIDYSQVTDSIMMVRPLHFGWNMETAVDNVFQHRSTDLSDRQVQDRALSEFDQFVEKLRSHSIQVVVVDSQELEESPDAVFPNNWVSFHSDGRVAMFPMFCPNRRKERRVHVIEDLARAQSLRISQTMDYSHYEIEDKFLEGTGSMVLDRVKRKAYAALSHRTNHEVLEEFCRDFGYTPVVFEAFSTHLDKRVPIYHTNVMMNVGEDFAVICAESIDSKEDRNRVLDHLRQDGKELVLITEEQNASFAGNMLQLKNPDGERFLVMSEQAYSSLLPAQIAILEKHNQIIYSPLDTIEANGGGSARCMIAEIFLPQ